jgi:acyl transferase domain-containing protein
MMQKNRIPKQANFIRLNPKIPALDKTIAIPTQTLPWPSAADPSSNAVAMVTNYGAAGSNAALVVKQHKLSSENAETVSLPPREVPIFIAATSPESLQSYCRVLKSRFRNSSPRTCQDLAYNLAIKQNRDLSHVISFSIPSDQPDRLLAKLELTQSQINAKKQPNHRLPVILCFGGQNGNEATLSEDVFNRSDLLQYHLVSHRWILHGASVTLGMLQANI